MNYPCGDCPAGFFARKGNILGEKVGEFVKDSFERT